MPPYRPLPDGIVSLTPLNGPLSQGIGIPVHGNVAVVAESGLRRRESQTVRSFSTKAYVAFPCTASLGEIASSCRPAATAIRVSVRSRPTTASAIVSFVAGVLAIQSRFRLRDQSRASRPYIVASRVHWVSPTA